MNIKRKMGTTTETPAFFYCYFCCRHILITFVGMTLLIVNYGAHTAQMSAEPQRNGSYIKSSDSSSRLAKTDSVLSFINSQTSYDSKKLLSTKSKIASNFEKAVWLQTPTIKEKQNSLKFRFNVLSNSNTSRTNQTELDLAGVALRKPRFFGLLGSNFSLSYNLTLSSGTSVGNITLVSPAPAPTYYYYSPAPSYPYYGYYYPNTYNPYAGYPQYYYDPSTAYAYYG